jgi:D-serine deaminase-like pyridoxal phosphate-dependent protein
VDTASTIAALRTPCLVLDEVRMERNLARMRAGLQRLGVAARPHVKTCKSLPVVQRMLGAANGPVTVSTLAEAEHCFAGGITDVLYAVGIAPGKLDDVLDLRARGCDLAVIVDHEDAAAAVAARGAAIPALIEIDSDDHRAGVRPDADALLEIAAALARGGVVRGVMTHAGGSYDCREPRAIAAVAERERAAVVAAATRLRAAGHAAPVVSVGSTPTATFAERLDGVTEARTGVHVFMDLVMVGLGVCTLGDVALSVACTVIGHQRTKHWLITDGGWMALSRDRGTASQTRDRGFGLVADANGHPLDELIVVSTNQEHGIVARADGAPFDLQAFPIGTVLRVLPNHACATAAQHDRYHVVRGGDAIVATWPRFSGW